LRKDFAIGFVMVIGFATKPKRMIFDVWCSDPQLDIKSLPMTEKSWANINWQQIGSLSLIRSMVDGLLDETEKQHGP
jgi:hypothetical protein